MIPSNVGLELIGVYRDGAFFSEPFIHDGYVIEIGYCWNGQSTPWWSWPFAGTPYDPRTWIASAIHDDIYARGERLVDGQWRPTTRLRADADYYERCVEGGDARWRAYLRYVGLRLGGWAKWNEYRRAR